MESVSTASSPPLKLDRQHRHRLPTAVLGLSASPDHQTLYVACFDGVYQVDPQSGQNQKLYEHGSYASSVHFLASRQPLLISGGYDGQLIWYDLTARQIIRRVQAHSFWSWQTALSPDGRHLASVTGQYLAGGYKYEPATSREMTVQVYDAVTGKLQHAWQHLPPVQAVAISPDSRWLAAANLTGDLAVWSLESGDLLSHWNTADFTSWGIIKSHCFIGGIYALMFSADGESLVAAGMGPMRDPMAGNGRQLWQKFAWRESPVRRIDETHDKQSGEGLMEALATRPQADWFVMAGRLRGGEWNAALFDWQTGDRLQHLKATGRITQARWSATGQQLYLAGTQGQPQPKDGTYADFGFVEVWNCGT